MALNTTNVGAALNGITLPAVPAGDEDDLQQIRGGVNITNNGNGSFTTVPGPLLDSGIEFSGITLSYLGQQTVSGANLTSSGYFGAATTEAVPVISFVYDTQTYYAYVLAFNATQVLLVGLTPAATAGTYTQNANRFLLNSDGASTTLSTTPVTVATTGAAYTAPNGSPVSCFVSGTRITTPDGFVLVENLSEGDLVTTISGEAKPVIWAGRRTIRVAAHRSPELVRPVTIRAGAFGENLPTRDLTVSSDHNVFVDGVLIPAKCLVNELNVVFADVQTVTYHHVELAAHDVVFAEGLPTETYLEVGNRSAFAGGAVVDAHPDFASTPDASYFAFEARGYAKLVLAGAELDAVRARLATQEAGQVDADRRAA